MKLFFVRVVVGNPHNKFNQARAAIGLAGMLMESNLAGRKLAYKMRQVLGDDPQRWPDFFEFESGRGQHGQITISQIAPLPDGLKIEPDGRHRPLVGAMCDAVNRALKSSLKLDRLVFRGYQAPSVPEVAIRPSPTRHLSPSKRDRTPALGLV